MAFEKNVPEWNAAGSEPPASLKNSGFQAGYKPPADYFNWFWYAVSQCLAELYSRGFDKYAFNIEAGSSMDDFVEVGIYTYSIGASSSIKNAPEHTQATVLVLPRLMNNNASNIIQVVITSTNRIFVRNRSDGEWNGWRKFFKDDDVIPITNGGTGAKTAEAARAALGVAPASHGRHVPSTCVSVTDWNDAVESGWYMGNNAANAPTNSSDGTTVWYFGYVIAHNENYVFQEAYHFTASDNAKYINKYIRAKKDGKWGVWTNVTVQRTLPENAILDGAKKDLSNVVASTIPSGADLNDYTTLGMYTYSSSSAASIANAPDPAQSTLLVLPRLTPDAHENRIQVLISLTEKVYVRNLQDGVWREWRAVLTQNDKPKITTYTDITQIGLTSGSETIANIAGNLPVNSMLYYTVSGSSNITEFPNSNYGLLVVDKTIASRIVFTFTNAGGVQYIGYYSITSTTNADVWTGWLKTYSSNDILSGTTDLSAGSTALASGKLYFTYE